MDVPDYNDVEVWIATLKECKPLSEKDVERLCEKVRHLRGRREKGARCPLFVALFAPSNVHWV
jgi:hypothetical protein